MKHKICSVCGGIADTYHLKKVYGSSVRSTKTLLDVIISFVFPINLFYSIFNIVSESKVYTYRELTPICTQCKRDLKNKWRE